MYAMNPVRACSDRARHATYRIMLAAHASASCPERRDEADGPLRFEIDAAHRNVTDALARVLAVVTKRLGR